MGRANDDRSGETGTMAATVTLVVVAGALRGEEFVFEERDTCVMGRAADCSPRLPNDREHRTISRHHCLLDINPPDIRVRDFGSRNGTFVNGVKIGQRAEGLTPEEAAGGDYPEHDLRDGDEIELGDTVMRVRIEVPAPAPPEPERREAERREAERRGPRGAGCAVCGRAAAGHLCDDCRNDPGAVVRHLLDEARDDPELAALDGCTLVGELGRGGMGAVFRARDPHGDDLALKVMLPRVAAGEPARRRFLREVELTGSLRHPNIARLHAYGSAHDVFFFTMEYCSDGSIDRFKAGALPLEDAVGHILQALDGLDHAHRQGVVHRDLSPQNILLHGGAAKLCDFGLAKAFDQAGLSGLTRTGSAAGKPRFMPRQQVVNFKNAKPEVDVWSMAASLYWLLTGFSPRDFSVLKDPWQVVLQDPAVPVRDRAPGVPKALAEVVDQALQERPAIGFSTAAEFRDALRKAL
jgi:pSer/pThr/pTyr-binding forkhead associated (FHA) protein